MRIPQILSPVASFKGAVEVISAGADEIYCAVKTPGVMHVLNRPHSCCVPTYGELGRIADHARSKGVGTVVTLELPFISEFMVAPMKEHISHCLGEGIDALIAGDIGLITLIRDMGLDIPIYASTLLAATNYQAVDFIRKLGVSRVILERLVSIDEIGEVVQRNEEVEIEVFAHGGGCSNINANCYLRMARTPPAAYREVVRGIKGRITPCRWSFDIYEFGSGGRKLARVPILDAFTFCSLCQLPDLIETGASGIKIVGRCMPLAYQVKATEIYRNLVDLVELGLKSSFNRAWRRRFRRMIESFKEAPFGPGQRNPDGSWPTPGSHRDVVCAEGRCYYSPLFYTPHRPSDSHSRVSWETPQRGWPKAEGV